MKTATFSPLFVLALFALVASGCSENATGDQLLVADGVHAGQATVPLFETEALGSSRRDSNAHIEVAAQEVLDSRHSGLLALSREEAAWLDRHGYPTSEELDALSTYDVGALEDGLRERKDTKAAALLGHRLLMDGDLAGARSAFAAGADLGSLYARQQMAIVASRTAADGTAGSAGGDPAVVGLMIAHLEVARMLGDHRAQSLIDQFSSSFDWKHYGKGVISQTANLMDSYGLNARAAGRDSRGPDPRPNAYEWSQLEADPGARVTIYTRSKAYP